MPKYSVGGDSGSGDNNKSAVGMQSSGGEEDMAAPMQR